MAFFISLGRPGRLVGRPVQMGDEVADGGRSYGVAADHRPTDSGRPPSAIGTTVRNWGVRIGDLENCAVEVLLNDDFVTL